MGKISEVVMRLTWAEHAFGLRRWTWACEEYTELAKLTSKNAPDTWALTQYKLGYCWNMIGKDLLEEAINFRHEKLLDRAFELQFKISEKLNTLLDLPNREVRDNVEFPENRQLDANFSNAVVKLDDKESSRFVNLLEAADWSIRASIAFHERYYKEGPERGERRCALIEYNNSCNWALRANLLMETEITEMTLAEIKKLSEEKEKHAVAAQHVQAVSNKRGKNIEERIEKFAREALNGLKSLRREPTSYTTPPVEDPTFLVTAARRDPDFNVLQRHSKFKEEFKYYTSDDNDILNSYKEARGKCVEIEEYVKEIDRRIL